MRLTSKEKDYLIRVNYDIKWVEKELDTSKKFYYIDMILNFDVNKNTMKEVLDMSNKLNKIS